MAKGKLTIIGDINSPVRVMPRQQDAEGGTEQIWAGPLGADGRVTLDVDIAPMAVLSPGMETAPASFEPGQTELTVILVPQKK